MIDEGASDTDALLLAAADLTGQAVHLVVEAHQVEGLGHLAADAAAVLAHHFQGVSDVLVHSLVGQQLEVLEHAADIAPQHGHPAAREVGHVAPGHQDAALGGLKLLEDHADEGGLARAGRPDHEHELALGDVERHLFHADHVAVVDLGYVLEDDHAVLAPVTRAVVPACVSRSGWRHEPPRRSPTDYSWMDTVASCGHGATTFAARSCSVVASSLMLMFATLSPTANDSGRS